GGCQDGRGPGGCAAPAQRFGGVGDVGAGRQVEQCVHHRGRVEGDVVPGQGRSFGPAEPVELDDRSEAAAPCGTDLGGDVAVDEDLHGVLLAVEHLGGTVHDVGGGVAFQQRQQVRGATRRGR